MFGKWLIPRALALIICITISACSGVEYVDNKGLVEMGIMDNGDNRTKPRKLGAIVINNTDEDAKDEAPRVFMLKRKKSRYMAETVLFDHKGKEKYIFDKSYFTIAADHKKKGLRFEVKFTY